VIVEYIRYRIPEDRQESFLADYGRAALSRAPQCLDYELSRSIDEPACSVLRITWTSAEDHLQGFRGGDLFPDFLAAIRPYVGDIERCGTTSGPPWRAPGPRYPRCTTGPAARQHWSG
jgi:quinol monooxygenase YgiN